jgi:plastocyanin
VDVMTDDLDATRACIVGGVVGAGVQEGVVESLSVQGRSGTTCANLGDVSPASRATRAVEASSMQVIRSLAQEVVAGLVQGCPRPRASEAAVFHNEDQAFIPSEVTCCAGDRQTFVAEPVSRGELRARGDFRGDLDNTCAPAPVSSVSTVFEETCVLAIPLEEDYASPAPWYAPEPQAPFKVGGQVRAEAHSEWAEVLAQDASVSESDFRAPLSPRPTS